MNIAIITSEFITERNFDGGLANYNYKLAKSLILLGHSPVVFVSSDRDEEIKLEDIRVFRVNVNNYDDFLFKSKLFCKSYTKLKRYLKANTGVIMNVELRYQSKVLNRKFRAVNIREKFDVVHYPSLGGVGLFRAKNIPAVARISGFTMGCHESGGYGEVDPAVKIQEKLEFNTLKKMDGIFGPSKMIANIISNEIKKEISIIETPFLFPKETLDQQLFKEKLEGKKYLLFFGSLGLIKGCGTIADILEDFFKSYPDYHFVFVGKILSSPDKKMNMLDFLKNKAGKYADRIIYFDKTPHRQLFPVIQNSSFVVLPSRIDNFPNTCIEAMGVGKIVIGTKGNGFEQMIIDKENGFLVEVDNSKQLRDAIDFVMNLSNEERIMMEEKAKKRIDLLKPEIIVKQLVDFYAEVINRFHKP